ncbi:MAG: nucleotidyl transferase AbiEii/AbiGii toxin family protein [Bacteroidota bacterium]
MIHTGPQIIEPQTLALLDQLMQDDHLTKFFLVGGTSLALQIGHRLSIDLDLFTKNPFDSADLNDYLVRQYNFNTTNISKNTVLGFLNGVKVDFIAHQYELVEPLIQHEHKRLIGLLDVGAMKLNAIGQNGQRQKDFYDVYYLLERYSLSSLLEAYTVKYPRSSTLIPLRGLTYFEEIRFELEPPMLVDSIKFEEVSNRLTQAVDEVDRVFSRS